MRAFHLFCLIAVSLSWSEGEFTFIRKLANRVMQSLTDLSTCLLGRDGVIVFDRVCVSQRTWKQRVGLDASELYSCLLFH